MIHWGTAKVPPKRNKKDWQKILDQAKWRRDAGFKFVNRGKKSVLEKIISGGQTGADRAGISVAKDLGYQTGGWMPKGFLAQDGCWPEFAEEFGMQEHSSPKYPPRTALNVKESDGTVRIATNFQSPGEKLTLKMVEQYQKPHFDVHPGITAPEELVEWIKLHQIRVLNVAGNSERTSKGMFKFAYNFLAEVLRSLQNSDDGNQGRDG